MRSDAAPVEDVDFGEPWTVGRWDGDVGLYDRHGACMGSVDAAVAPGVSRERLARIAACVNACRGIPSDQLGRLPELLWGSDGGQGER